jgi:hypothetical protein
MEIGAMEIGAVEFRLLQVGAVEIGAMEIRVGEQRALELEIMQVGPVQVGPLAHLPARPDPRLVPFQNRFQPCLGQHPTASLFLNGSDFVHPWSPLS